MKRNKRKNNNSSKTNQILFEDPFNGLDRKVLREAFAKRSKDSKKKYPEILAQLVKNIKEAYPPNILATITFYSLIGSVSESGVRSGSSKNKAQQHHIEILQALILTIPESDWGSKPASPELIQSIIENIKELSDAFIARRFAPINEDATNDEKSELLLQEKLRIHTQVVRNWGYFSNVVKISTELYSALDSDFLAHYGFSATEFISTLSNIVKKHEERANKHCDKLRIFMREKKPNRIVRKFSQEFPDAIENIESFLSELDKDESVENLKFRLLAHTDIKLVTGALYEIEEVSAATKIPKTKTQKIFDAVSLEPSALKDENVEFFFMSNPIWLAPIIKIGGQYLGCCVQIAFSHIHSIMLYLAENAGFKDKLDNIKATYLENKTANILRMSFPKVKIKENVKWEFENTNFETDLLVEVDQTLFIIESKSAALTPEGLRGAPKRAKRHVSELIVEPAKQSIRLKKIVEEARKGDKAALETLKPTGIDAQNIENIIRISVTLYDFSCISALENELKDAGWVPSDLLLPATVNIADFECVADILDRISFFSHYFLEREKIQKFSVHGDELDFLGMYLTSGFNTSALNNNEINLVLSGMSSSIDNYYMSLDAGIKLKKPKPNIHEELLHLIDAIEVRASAGWSTIAIELLRVGDYKEQKQIFNGIQELKKSVKKNFRKPEYINSIVVSPPEGREYAYIFYVYPEKLRHERKNAIEQLCANAMEEQRRGKCIFISKKIEDWQTPYNFVGIARKAK